MKEKYVLNRWVGRALASKKNVMAAVMLRDMRTRFFDHGIGFLMVSLWPLAHMSFLLTLYNLSGRQAPFGDSLNMFFATGLIPTLAFIYVSRFMSVSLILNKPMLGFPVVKVLDVMAGRAALEIVAAALTLFFVLIILVVLGENVLPYDMVQAVFAYMATILLAIGVGTFAGVLSMFFPFFTTVYALLMITVYISSGTLFVASSLPDGIAVPLSWNPILQCVEWTRVAYFEGYSDRLLSREYLVGFGMGSMFLGLFLEKIFRGKMLEG